MNKFVLAFVVVAILAVALGTAGFVYAQAPTPPTLANGSGYGPAMGSRGARAGMTLAPGSGYGVGVNPAGAQNGLLHDEMIAAYAQKLGVSLEDLNARLAKGETMAQIAYSKGLTADQFRTLMTEARVQAIDQAVKNGTLTQEQADWMKQHGAGMTVSPASRAGVGSGRGAGMGRFANPDCPYFTQPNS
jgi:hypothetical protein